VVFTVNKVSLNEETISAGFFQQIISTVKFINYFEKKNTIDFFINPSIVFQFGFGCVALLYCIKQFKSKKSKYAAVFYFLLAQKTFKPLKYAKSFRGRSRL